MKQKLFEIVSFLIITYLINPIVCLQVTPQNNPQHKGLISIGPFY